MEFREVYLRKKLIYRRKDIKSEKIVIFDWGGIVESHENNFQDRNKAK